MDHIMDNMMRSMLMPFGDMGILASMGHDPFSRSNNLMGMLEGNNQMMNNGLQLMQPQRGGQGQFMQPPNLFGQMMFPSFPGSMVPGGVVHSSFSSTSYTTDEHGRRHVYQESHASTQGPGGVKETKSSVRDSRTGHQEMSIGHHIADKAHIKKKSKNVYTGDEEQVVDCINLDEAEVDQFEQEWQQKTASCYATSKNNKRSMMLNNHGAPARLALPSSAGEDMPDDLSQCRDGAFVNQSKPISSGGRSKSRPQKNSRSSPDLSPMHNASSSTKSIEGKISKKIKDLKNKLISKKSQSGKDHQSKRES